MNRRELVFFGAALALHLAAPFVLRRAHPALARSSHAADAYTTVEVDFSPPAPSAPPPSREEPVARLDPARPAAMERARVSRGVEPTAPAPAPGPLEPSAPPSPSSAPAAPAPAPTGDGYDAPEAVAMPGTGLGAAPAWAIPGVLPSAPTSAPAPTVAPRPRPVDRDRAGQLLRESIAAKDHALGLDLPGVGAVATAIADAVRASDVPAASRSTFQVRLDASGRAVSVHAVRFSSGDAGAWQRAAEIARQHLAGLALAMIGAYAEGAVVTVEITSLLTLPSGSNGPTIQPGVGASGTFDLSDLGAKPRRVVRSSYRVAPG